MRDTTSHWVIRGKVVPTDGDGSNPEWPIAASGWSLREPSVVHNTKRNEYVVTWNLWGPGSPPSIPGGVQGRRVLPNGSNPDAGVMVDGTYSAQQSDIAYHFNFDECLVVWKRVTPLPPTGTGSDIWASRLSYKIGGYLDVGTPFSITHSTKDETRPAVATNQVDRYIVVYEYEYSDTDRDIYGQELDSGGNKVGLSPFQIASTGRDETHPDVVAVPAIRDYFAAWQRTESITSTIYESIWAQRWGSGVTRYQFEVTPRVWDNWTPAVGTDRVGHLIAYAGKPATSTSGPVLAWNSRHIYGRVWWPEAVYVPLVLKGE